MSRSVLETKGIVWPLCRVCRYLFFQSYLFVVFSKLHAHVIHIIGRYYRWFFFIKPTKESTSTTSHNCQSIIKSTKNIVVFTRGGIPYIPLYPLIICFLSASESLKILKKQLELFICLDSDKPARLNHI